jgi:hypothetical protein
MYTDAKKAGKHSAEVRSPVSVLFLHLRSCYLWRFSYITKASYFAQQKNLSWSTVFLISVYSGLKCFPSLLVITGIPEIPLNFRNISLFTATCNNNCPSARCFSPAHHACEGVDILRKTTKTLKYFLCQSLSLLYEIIFFLDLVPFLLYFLLIFLP